MIFSQLTCLILKIKDEKTFYSWVFQINDVFHWRQVFAKTFTLHFTSLWDITCPIQILSIIIDVLFLAKIGLSCPPSYCFTYFWPFRVAGLWKTDLDGPDLFLPSNWAFHRRWWAVADPFVAENCPLQYHCRPYCNVQQYLKRFDRVQISVRSHSKSILPKLYNISFKVQLLNSCSCKKSRKIFGKSRFPACLLRKETR